ncbi:hypothetical protein V4V36_14355 [Paenibacillus lautus]|uniref:hypothetical protein n=1 Tax=Paenibacillus lautus TaxID=1401 RepID=UPI002FBD78BA
MIENIIDSRKIWLTSQVREEKGIREKEKTEAIDSLGSHGVATDSARYIQIVL